MSIGRFYFDTNMMAMELDIDFTAKQTQRILDAFIEPPVKGNKRITYWENGKKQSVLKFKKGQLHGKCKWYHEDQRKERIVKFKNGMYHGKYIDFNSEGKISLRIFEQDEQVGETKEIN
jgi:antitoxin component YwqK of YwqJK toxin-antitoxin module